jgi:outer membrane usher protein FimD/PapC
MKKDHVLKVSILAVLSVLIIACSFSASTAKINEVYLATDDAGNNKVSAFTPNDIFYALVDLKNAPDDTEVKAVWYAVEVPDIDPNYLIDEFTIATGSGVIPFSLTNDGPWPAGSYKVEVYLNGELNQTLEFNVE